MNLNQIHIGSFYGFAKLTGISKKIDGFLIGKLSINDIYNISKRTDPYFYIPLSIFDKENFEFINTHFLQIKNDLLVDIDYNKKECKVFYKEIEITFGYKIEYIHQLQNVYESINGSNF
jgi:hypothetical protein